MHSLDDYSIQLLQVVFADLEHLERQEMALIAENITSNITLPEFNSGDTAWMLFSSVLVLAMTVPGVALFYGGLVPGARSFVATAMQTISITCLITFLWLIAGYSLSFGPIDNLNNTNLFGDFSKAWFSGIDIRSFNQLANTIPESVYCIFQLTFAIITPALICGGFVERMKFSSLLIFISFWHIFVYCPIAHANWHPGGFLFKAGVLDFAGGNVVHISSGVTALIASFMVGKGMGTKKPDPNNLITTFIGGSFLWVGWFGFNAGSAGGANQRAAMAMLATQIATACAGLSGMLTALLITKKPSVLSMLSGCVSGLVAITPAAGFVDPSGAFIIGIIAGPLCYFGTYVKHGFGVDDTLDAFGIHAVGGVVGGFLTGIFAKNDICGIDGAYYGRSRQLFIQLYGITFTFAWTAIVSYVLLKIIDLTVGLKGSESKNKIGMNNNNKGILSPQNRIHLNTINNNNMNNRRQSKMSSNLYNDFPLPTVALTPTVGCKKHSIDVSNHSNYPRVSISSSAHELIVAHRSLSEGSHSSQPTRISMNISGHGIQKYIIPDEIKSTTE